MSRILAASLLCLALSGCMATQKSLITTCSGYAVSLSTLADFRKQGKLSQGTQDTVDKVNSVVVPLCDPTKPLPVDVSTAINVVEPAAAQLAALIAGVK